MTHEFWVDVHGERRLANEEETAALLKIQADYRAEIEAEEKAKAEAAIKRQALLDKLGITEDEARLLLGGN